MDIICVDTQKGSMASVILQARLQSGSSHAELLHIAMALCCIHYVQDSC